MIQLKEIEIQNYKSLVRTRLSLKTNLTALIGINGSGKTNTLRAITLLSQLSIGGLRHRRFYTEKDNLVKSELISTFENDGKVFKLKSILYFDNLENDDQVQYFELYIRKVGKDRKWTPLHTEVFDFAKYVLRHGEKRNLQPYEVDYLPKDEESQKAVFALTSFLSEIKYYGATQFSDPQKSPISIELDEERLTRNDPKYPSHKQFLFDLYSLKNSNLKAFTRYLNSVNELGVKLVNDITFSQIEVPNSSVKVMAGGQTQKINSQRTFVVPVFNINGLQLSPTQLSEGTFKTLALIFYILNDKSQLLLIEEPEVCVHHGLLSSVIELVKRQSIQKQIIISTHSDYVLDKLKPENVVLVKKEEQGTEIESLTDALSAEDFKALKTYLEKTGNLGEYWKEDGFFNE